MPIATLGSSARSIVAFAATSVPLPAPVGDVGIHSGNSDTVRLLLDFEGVVTECNIALYLYDRESGKWYFGLTTDLATPLFPEDGDGVRDWFVGRQQEFSFIPVVITGGGTVAGRVRGIAT